MQPLQVPALPIQPRAVGDRRRGVRHVEDRREAAQHQATRHPPGHATGHAAGGAALGGVVVECGALAHALIREQQQAFAITVKAPGSVDSG